MMAHPGPAGPFAALVVAAVPQPLRWPRLGIQRRRRLPEECARAIPVLQSCHTVTSPAYPFVVGSGEPVIDGITTFERSSAVIRRRCRIVNPQLPSQGKRRPFRRRQPTRRRNPARRWRRPVRRWIEPVSHPHLTARRCSPGQLPTIRPWTSAPWRLSNTNAKHRSTTRNTVTLKL